MENPDAKPAVGKKGKKEKDKAMLSSPSEPKYGGIDLNSVIEKLEVEGNGQKLEFDLKQIEQLKSIEGFSPVIYQIAPIPLTNLPLILGSVQPADDTLSYRH